MTLPTLVAVVGPTGVGKSALAVRVARQIDGEIVNADSMQLYRGMDIGTAKPTETERGGVPHHLFDVWDVTDQASVAEYQRLALAAVREIRGRGRIPILVGGSGLYVRAVVDEIDFPGTDPTVRDRLERELADVGAPDLHRRLAVLDPAAARAILPSNGRRIVRALEVIEISGRPFSATLPSYDERVGCRQIGLDCADLDTRIEARVDRMWGGGLVDEVRGLVAVGLRAGRTASRALGYAQVLEMLDGRCSADEARTRTQQATRRFARRQRSWLRRDPRVSWVDADSPELDGDVLRRTLD